MNHTQIGVPTIKDTHENKKKNQATDWKNKLGKTYLKRTDN